MFSMKITCHYLSLRISLEGDAFNRDDNKNIHDNT